MTNHLNDSQSVVYAFFDAWKNKDPIKIKNCTSTSIGYSSEFPANFDQLLLETKTVELINVKYNSESAPSLPFFSDDEYETVLVTFIVTAEDNKEADGFSSGYVYEDVYFYIIQDPSSEKYLIHTFGY